LGKQVKAAMNALLGSIPSPIAGKSDYSPPEIHYPLLVIPRACDFIRFRKKPMVKTKNLGASKSAKNQ
jgi:hypothetical protein